MGRRGAGSSHLTGYIVSRAAVRVGAEAGGGGVLRTALPPVACPSY